MTTLQQPPQLEKNKKLKAKFEQFQKLLLALEERELPEEIETSINQEIEKVNTFSGDAKALQKLIAKSHQTVFQKVHKELKLVTKNYYLLLWMSLGMSSFGLPIGIAVGLSLNNMALMAAFLPVGMAIGMAVGAAMDKKAEKDGLLLEV